MTWSKHAKRRSQQRSIDDAAIQAALDWGTMIRQYGGSRVYHLGRRDVRRADRQGESLQRYRGVAVIVSRDGVVITVVRTSDRRRLARGRKG